MSGFAIGLEMVMVAFYRGTPIPVDLSAGYHNMGLQ